MEQLKGYILYSLLLPDWPSKDFGYFVDHFGSYSGLLKENYLTNYRGSIGINDITFKTIAKSLFDIEDIDPGIRVWWLPTLERSNLTEADMTNLEQKSTHTYPLPAWLAHLVVPGNVTEDDVKSVIAHPAFIENLTPNQLLKMFKFGLWTKYKSNLEDANKTLSEVLQEELKVFEDRGFNLRADFQVTYSDH